MKTWGSGILVVVAFGLLTMPVLAQGTKDGAKEEAVVEVKGESSENSSA